MCEAVNTKANPELRSTPEADIQIQVIPDNIQIQATGTPDNK